MPQKKRKKEKRITEREKRKDLEPKKYKLFKKKEAARVREYRFKKQLQVRTAASISETIPTTSSVKKHFFFFDKKNFKPKCSQD